MFPCMRLYSALAAAPPLTTQTAPTAPCPAVSVAAALRAGAMRQQLHMRHLPRPHLRLRYDGQLDQHGVRFVQRVLAKSPDRLLLRGQRRVRHSQRPQYLPARPVRVGRRLVPARRRRHLLLPLPAQPPAVTPAPPDDA